MSTSPRVILDPAGHTEGTGEGLRALIRALARQAARDYVEHENGPIRTRSEE
ncbi:hypothetical protein GOB87_11160 [Acetobacter estunensis]|uniref:Uncharacterized protein n=1 Tax=Acetobacter estunensis TaxID=104097 RepID=A0A967EHY2_9PROT|nr:MULTISPECIES: hypothetical protein [Acetobacter]MBB3884526.1 hypothetical protein [Acetobacter oeni]MCG0999436.1 hypothetical protein [Acetobacter persici]NHO20445.1 hypothetical protein [Acetobacter oeni]NHO54502.1 hypothetical protein [Acetobacter estunensis]